MRTPRADAILIKDSTVGFADSTSMPPIRYAYPERAEKLRLRVVRGAHPRELGDDGRH
jgi:hypothetical protein